MPTGQPPIYVLKADFFKVLGHPARVRILELLQDGERNVGELQVALDLDSSGTSQHLGVLRKIGLLETRRDGTSVYYRLRDPRTLQLLDLARQILLANLTETQTLLQQLAADMPNRGSSRRRASARPRVTPGTDGRDEPAR